MKDIPFSTVIVLAVVGWPVSSSAEDLTPEGVWLHDNGRIQVKITPCDERHEALLCNKIVWLKNPDSKEGKPRLDSQNPDHAERDQPVIGTTVIQGLVRNGPGLWTDGTIYNPEDGNSYSGRVKVVDANTLRVRAYVILPLLGETKVWTRVEN